MAASRRVTAEMYNKMVAQEARKNDFDRDYYANVSKKLHNNKLNFVFKNISISLRRERFIFTFISNFEH